MGILALTSRTPVRRLGWPGLGARSKAMLLGAGHVLDECGAPEALGGPILINGHHANRLKIFLAKSIPAVVPVNLGLVFLGSPLGISEPYDGVAFGLAGNRGSQGIDLFLSRDERQGKSHLFRFLQVANDLDALQGSEFAFETAR